MNKQKSFKSGTQKGTLYLVPTPIGNLEDMTFRGVKILEQVDLIASEDTRNTQKLLNHFDIKVPQISLHEHNYKEKIPTLLAKLEQGINMAQVSDAGMPSISDPGHELVLACIEEEIPVVALPGATAGMTALIASGLTAEPFTFVGFLPRKKKEQKQALENYLYHQETLIFYESPYRVRATLINMLEIFGESRQVVVARELTKIHEEYLRGTLEELVNYLSDHELKGECVILLQGSSQLLAKKDNEWLDLTISQHVEQFIKEENLTSKEAIKKVAKIRGVKKQEVYSQYHGIN